MKDQSTASAAPTLRDLIRAARTAGAKHVTYEIGSSLAALTGRTVAREHVWTYGPHRVSYYRGELEYKRNGYVMCRAQVDSEEQAVGIIAAYMRAEWDRVRAEWERLAANTYVIWSHHYSMWWKPESRGYTVRIADAGRYSLAAAQGEMNRGCGCCQVPEVPVADDRLNDKKTAELDCAIALATEQAIAEGRTNRCCEAAQAVTR